MTTAPEAVVPYITAREGEEADSFLNLRMGRGPDGRPRLRYVDELPPDRDLKDVLWARYSMSLDTFGQPCGTPRWRMVHPHRQRVTMALLRCQVCTVQLKRTDGILFLETAGEEGYDGPVKTAQPPVCLEHARMAAGRCPRLRARGHVALLATRFPLYGVIGHAYQWSANGLQALSDMDSPIPYRHPQIGMFLASQLVRELREYKVVNLDDLVPAA
ncbi:hypothetical protein [Streptomyces sp. G-G2]|uniref:hypothetical protein n=1 Tax=unclassified Streptomyces TaxID=2593676 RepID=UPI0024BAB0EE|nr:hypothetical protein [Streptomyces sp. G-G2]MDJ0380825.1 hypothetical protein [Streptomyces sp. G-G2]